MTKKGYGNSWNIILESVQEFAPEFEDESTFDFWFKGQEVFQNYTQAVDSLNSGASEYALLPWTELDFQRSDEFVIAALSPRLNMSYILQDPGGTKNLSRYTELDTIHCNDNLSSAYLRNFNSDVKIEHSNLSTESISVHLDRLDLAEAKKEKAPKQISLLSTKEFIPPIVHGILIAICYRHDIDTRKHVGQFHDPISKDIGNIERGLEVFFRESDKQIIAANVQMDINGNYHAALAIKDKEIQYYYYSQSTVLDFVEIFTAKI